MAYGHRLEFQEKVLKIHYNGLMDQLNNRYKNRINLKILASFDFSIGKFFSIVVANDDEEIVVYEDWLHVVHFLDLIH